MERLVRQLEVLTLVLCVACASAGGVHVSADDARAVDSLFAAYTGDSIPGASVVVIQNGAVTLRRAYGLADLARHVAATPETDYRLASLSKQFTAMAVMLLVNDGALRYDQPVRDILLELPPSTRAVTIRHLLNHTAGIRGEADLGMLMQSESETVRSKTSILDCLKDELFDSPPGRVWRYSNFGYCLLGALIERVTGDTYASYVQRSVLLVFLGIPSGPALQVAHDPPGSARTTIPEAGRERVG